MGRSAQKRSSAFSLVELLVVLGIIVLLVAMALPAIQRVRAGYAMIECRNNLRNIGLALHTYHSDYKRFPPGCSVNSGKDDLAYMSWCTRILPYLENSSLWNRALSDYKAQPVFYLLPRHYCLDYRMPIFRCPLDERELHENTPRAALLSYIGNLGLDYETKDGVLFVDSRISISMILDGLSNTLLAGERPPSAKRDMGWWYAGWGQFKDGSGDSVLGVREINVGIVVGQKCPRGPYQFVRGSVGDQCSAFHYWSLHPGGANFLFTDSSVRFLQYSADPILPALASRSGHEPVTSFDD